MRPVKQVPSPSGFLYLNPVISLKPHLLTLMTLPRILTAFRGSFIVSFIVVLVKYATVTYIVEKGEIKWYK